jgi:uncharacterized protein
MRRSFKLVVNSTEQCNLRCVYCYETFEHGHMTPETADGVVRFIEGRADAGLDRLDLEFFGGEPLKAWFIVQRIARGAHDACGRHGVAFSGGMTTNATILSEDRLDWLARHGVTAFQITLDGPRETHNARRVWHGGVTGTFDMVWDRLAMIRASDVAGLEVTIRLHFDMRSWVFLPGFIGELAETFLRDPRFKLAFYPIGDWGGGSVDGIEYFDGPEDSNAAIDDLLASAVTAGINQSQLPQLDADAQSERAFCYAARPNAFVVRSNGSISKCTVAFDDDRNIIGKIAPDGELAIDHDRHIPWMRGLASGGAAALACPARGYIWP